MPQHKIARAVFPGTFDPVTLGHLDIIERGSRLFDEVVVMVGENPEKTDLFTVEERVEMVIEQVRNLPNVSVTYHAGLTLDFVRSMKANFLLRGIRDTSDLRNELQQANTNLIVGGIETLFLMTTDRLALVSSSIIKQIVSLGGYDDKGLLRLVPPEVAQRLHDKLARRG
jgi:pantetheine-phosphate adenylyltransferase